tara:strand:+ start:683 stop:1522 length:840 start_codon:yes stop_codon:yes gene_type:complete
MPPKISIGTSQKPKKPPKPSAPTKASFPKAKTAPKTKRIAPEIANAPLYRKGTEERATWDAEQDKKTSQNVFNRLKKFMEWMPNARYPKQISDSPQFAHCAVVMNSPDPISLLSQDKTRRGIISRFVDLHAPYKGNHEHTMLESQIVTQTLHDNIQHHIDECRGHLASGDSESAGECIQILDDLAQHASPQHSNGLFGILEELKDSMVLLASNPEPESPFIADPTNRFLPPSKIQHVNAREQESAHMVGSDSESDGELTSGDMSDDDIDVAEEIYDVEL